MREERRERGVRSLLARKYITLVENQRDYKLLLLLLAVTVDRPTGHYDVDDDESMFSFPPPMV